MKNLNKNHIVKNLLACFLTMIMLSSCGGGGSCGNCATPTPAPGTLTLAIAAPSQYPAGIAVTAYLTMTNTSNVDGNNLVYTVPSATNYTGVTITTNPTGAGEDCTNIAAGASCTFTANIPAGSKPGSFTVLATPNSSTQSKLSILSKLLKADTGISVTANLGLVDVPNTQNSYFILPEVQTISAKSNESTTVMLSVWIKQASQGLNSLKLVDELGESLVFTSVSTPLYTVNSVNTYKVTIPAGRSVQHVQALSNVCTTLNTGTNNGTACSNDADINLASQGNGILTVQPSYFNMTESYNKQILTLTNTGTGTVSSIQYPNFNSLGSEFSIESNNCISIESLSVGQSCNMTVVYTADSKSGQITPVFTYDDDNNSGTVAKNTEITIPYTGKTSLPYSVLTVQPSSISLTAENPRREITLTNTPGGSTVGADISDLTLPTLSPPLEFESSNCTSSLSVNSSCVYTIKYSTASEAGESTLEFTYSNGIASNQVSNLAVDWEAISNVISYAYVVGNTGENPSKIWKCQITSNGSFSSCDDANKNSSIEVVSTSKMAFTQIGDSKVVYITAAPNLYRCNLGTDGYFDSCSDLSAALSGLASIDQLYGVTVTSVGNQNYLYLTNRDNTNGFVYNCLIDANGDISNCANTGAVSGMSPESPYGPQIASPTAISFATFGSIKYAYISGGSGLTTCEVNLTDASLNSCKTAYLFDLETSLGDVFMLTGYQIGTTSYLYTGVFDAIGQCTLPGSNPLTKASCPTSSVLSANQIGGMAFFNTTSNLSLYVASATNKTGVYLCPVNVTTGAVSKCNIVQDPGSSHWGGRADTIAIPQF